MAFRMTISAWLALALILCRGASPAVGQPQAEPPETPALAPYAGPTSAAPDSAPAIVFLPPRLEVETTRDATAAAEAACDRLAQELAASGTVQVVNRTELSRILQERRIAGNVQRPITGYSAMIRLEVDNTQVEPTTSVRVIDLSTGNVLGEQNFAWPLTEPDVEPMTGMCRTAIGNADRLVKEKTRIRAFGARDTGQQVRMKPLAMRLETAYQQALAQSKDVLLVQHLEAATSQEESLLLLMGLSRLPGGKQFTPQADATIELQVTEGDGLGRTFDETPVTVAVRLNDSGKSTHDWIRTEGTVREFDRLIERSWQSLSKRLTAVEPGSAGRSLKQMALRRTQARAELQAAHDVYDEEVRHKKSEHLRKALAHCDAALKIDPTFPDPYLFKGRLLFDMALYYFMYSDTRPMQYDANGDLDGPHIRQRNRASGQSLLSCARYVSHPASDRAQHGDAFYQMLLAVRFTPLKRVHELQQVDMTPYNQRLLEALTVGLENCLNAPDRTNITLSVEQGAIIVYQGMKLSGTSRDERRAVLQRFEETYDRWIADYRRNGKPKASSREAELEERRYLSFKVLATSLLKNDGLSREASSRLAALTNGAGNEGEKIRRYQAELARLRGQETASPSPPPAVERKGTLLAIKWPSTDVLQAKSSSAGRRPDVPSTAITRHRQNYGIHRYQAMSPIAADDRRAYFILADRDHSVTWYFDGGGLMSSNTAQLAWVDLDDGGRPRGKIVTLPSQAGRRQTDVWEPLHVPGHQPTGLRSAGGICAQSYGGRLHVGTRDGGLMIFDPERSTWKTYGPEEGLPSKSIHSFFFLDRKRLYVSTDRFAADTKHYTLNLETGSVKLLHQADGDRKEFYSARLLPMWWDGDKLVGKLRTDLLSADPPYRPERETNPVCSAIGLAEIGGRRFVKTIKGFHEFDRHGKVVRSWPDGAPSFRGSGSLFRIPRIANVPHQGRNMVQAGQLLVFVDDDDGLVAFDPETETWFGPMGNWDIDYAIGTAHGMWLGGTTKATGREARRGAFYIDEQDFLQAAREAGRAYTSREYAERLRNLAGNLPPFDRAKLSLMLRRHKEALTILNDIVEAEPENAEALFLRGVVQGPSGLRRPQAALADFRALTQLPHPSAFVTGLFFELLIHEQTKNYPEIIRVGEKLQNEVPNLDRLIDRNIDYWLNHARKSSKQVDSPGGK